MIIKERGNLFDRSWSSALSSPVYRTKFLLGAALFAALLLFYPHFFIFVQSRTGVPINDPVLNILPPKNYSVYIFSIIYLFVCFGIYRSVQSPSLFLLYLWGSFFVGLSRIITMTLVPLEPPTDLIPLVDPILALFYRHNRITKDLFYSGHTGSVFLIYLILRNKREKFFALLATIAVGVLLLFQHIHYFIDVLFAPAFVYMVFLLSKRITNYPFTYKV